VPEAYPGRPGLRACPESRQACLEEAREKAPPRLDLDSALSFSVVAMSLTQTERQFLSAHRRGYLATVTPGGRPQVKPVGFAYNTELETIDIVGFNMASSAKYRNVRANPEVSFVIDEVASEGVDGARFLEIRGLAEAVAGPGLSDSHLAAEFIRIRPRRVLSYNIDPERPGLHARDVRPASSPAERRQGANADGG
jgi:pyridoxamine 5'-phosphate oxidase family protein